MGIKVGLRSLLALFGKSERKVAAVFGVSPESSHAAVMHLRKGAPAVPVWLFVAVPPLPETRALCERVYVNRDSISLFIQAQIRLWPYWVAIGCAPQEKDPSLRSLLREAIFVMQAAEHGSFHHSVSDRQPVSVLVGRDMLRDGLRQTGA